MKSIEINNYKKYNIKGYKILFDLENLMRSTILTVLRDKENDWWSEIGTKQWVKKIDDDKELNFGSNLQNDIDKERKKDGKFLGRDQFLMHKIYYADMGHLYDIIEFFWENYFCNIFIGNSPKKFFHDFDYVRYLRNKVMHAKPIMEHEIDTINNFYEYIKKETRNLKLIEFDRCVYIGQILIELNDELKQHKNSFDKNHYREILGTEFYLRYTEEWWWDSEDFVLGSDINSYFEEIKKINSMIEDIRINKYTIIAKIEALSIKDNCELILNELNAMTNAGY